MKRKNLKYPIFSFAVIAFVTVFTALAQSSEDWVRVRDGEIPGEAVIGGYESGGGSKTFVCRTVYRGNYIGGKAFDGKCFYNPGRGERSTSRYEVLVGDIYKWSRTGNFDRAVAVGGTDIENFYVCRVSDDDGFYPGRTENGRCFYSRNGRGYSSSRFEVLLGDRYSLNLLGAALRGDFQAVRDALREGQAINQTDTGGKTALILASEKGFERVVRELLYERAAVDIVDKNGNTALMLAASNGHADVVRSLQREGANFYARNNDGETAFTLAASGGHARLVSDFLNFREYGEVERFDLERGFRNAAYFGHTDVLRILFNYGVSIESPDLNSKTALMQAASNRRVEAVRFLLQNEAGVNTRDNSGLTPFLYAVLANSDDVLRIFMEEREYIKADDPDAETGLHIAAQKDRRKSLLYLLEKGVEINSRNSFDDMTALMLASAEGHDETAEILIKANADLNLQNKNGETALILAAANSKNNTTKLLIKAGADLNLRDSSGLTALGRAIQNKHKDTRKTLQKAGAKP